MKQKKTRKIVEGATIAAIFGALFLIDLYLGGMLGYWLYFILPILVVWYGYKYELKDSLTLCIVVFCVTFIVASPMSLYYAVSAMLAGMVIGYCVKNKKNGTTLFLSTIAVTLLSNVLMYTVFAKLFEMDLIAEATEIYNMVVSLSADILPNATFISLQTFLQFVPLILLFMAVIEAYVMIVLMMLVLPRLKVPFQYRFNFLLMQLPKSFLLIGAVVFGIHYVKKDLFIINYLDIIIKAIIVLQGVSLVGLYFTLNKHVILYFIAMLLLFIPYSWLIYGILGIADIMIGLKQKLLYNRTN